MKIFALGLLLLLSLIPGAIFSLDFVPQVPHAYQVRSLSVSENGRFLLYAHPQNPAVDREIIYMKFGF